MENEKSVKNISDILPKVSANFEGKKINDLNDIKDKEVIVKDYVIVPSDKYHEGGKYAVVSASLDEEMVVFFGTEVMVDQLEKIGKDNCPFKAVIEKKKGKKSGKYYFCFA